MDGVKAVTVGYAGGTTENPTYESISDYTEAIRIEFNPNVITYDQLLKEFFARADVKSRSWSRQYRNAILYHNDAQLAAVEKATAGRNYPGLDVEPATTFYRGEEYHQKYIAKQNAAHYY